MRVADYVINYIYDHGTDYIFTLSGGGAMFLNDAVAVHKKIKYICHHHEQAAAMAAEAYAKTKHKIGAVIVTSGPGSTNAITGLLEAWQNSIPCIFISSQAKKSQMTYFSEPGFLRQFGIQEVNIIPIVVPLTKYAVSVEKSDDINYHLEKAYHEALSGRPGPVWIDIPADVAASAMDPKTLTGFNKKGSNIQNPKSSTDEINKVTQFFKNAKKPLLVAGGGIRLANAVTEFRKLVNVLGIPVIVTNMGLDLLEYDNPHYIGHGGTKGQRAANIAVQNADLILSIGSRLAVPFIGHEYDKFADKAKKIVVDIDKEEHKKKTLKIDFFIHSDAKYFIESLLKKIKKTQWHSKNDWLRSCIHLKNTYGDNFPTWQNEKNKINMYKAIRKISEYSEKGDHFVFDTGATAYVSTQTLKLKKNQRVIVPGATLTMGYNLPAIIGIWAAFPKSRILCIAGDGSFQMNIHELQTIVHHSIPAKIFVINNQGYLAIRITQKNFFQGRMIGEGITSGVSIPDTGKVSRAYGIKFFRIKTTSELKKTIPKVLNYPGPVICEIICPKWQDILTVSSKKLSDGRMVSLPIDDMYPFLPEKEMDTIRKKLSNY